MMVFIAHTHKVFFNRRHKIKVGGGLKEVGRDYRWDLTLLNIGIKTIFETHKSYTVLKAVVEVLRWPIVGPIALRGAAGIAFELARYPSNRASLRRAIALEVDVARNIKFAEERWALAALAVALLRAPIPKLVSPQCSGDKSNKTVFEFRNIL